jgi:hypothetical protein
MFFPFETVRTQNRKRETEIETLLLEVLRKQNAPVPPPVLSEDEHFLKAILPSLQRLPPNAKEQIKFQMYTLLHEANCVYNPVEFNLINQFGPVDD